MGNFALSCSFIVFWTLASIYVAMAATSAEEQLHIDLDMYTQLLRRVKNLENRDHDQQAEIDTLRGELYTEKKRTSMLEGRLARLQRTLGQPRNRGVETIADDASVVKRHVDDMNREQEIEETPGKRGNRIRRQIGTPVVHIAFKAHLDAYTSHVGIHQVIVFDNVRINDGNGYNQHLGAFIAPVSGVYVFHTTLVIDGDDAYFCIVKNGEVIAAFYSGKAALKSYSSITSEMIVEHLNKGDAVTVQNYSSIKHYWGYGENKFMGFLLYADDTVDTIVG